MHIEVIGEKNSSRLNIPLYHFKKPRVYSITLKLGRGVTPKGRCAKPVQNESPTELLVQNSGTSLGGVWDHLLQQEFASREIQVIEMIAEEMVGP